MPRPLQVDLLTLKLASESRANFSLPRPLCCRLRPDVARLGCDHINAL